MTCKEFQEVLPDIMDGGQTVEQEAHWKSCPECSSLASDLALITQQAKMLRGIDEPSPRVWNSLEIVLREEGLIHQPAEEFALVPSPARRWRMGWLVPLAATFLVTFGLVDYYLASKPPAQVADVVSPPVNTANANPVDDDDAQMLEAVSMKVPAMRATYEANLQDVNAYIRDAEASARNNPADEEAQESLMEAYAQKNMVYEMAFDRSLR
jgi:hypothetical protein